MTAQLACSKGHRWSSSEAAAACPVCGEMGVAHAETASLEAVAANAATLPPEDSRTGAVQADASERAPAFLAGHPRYRVLELLGQGGMGAVYKAEHRLMQRFVALKVIGHHLTGDSGAIQRFHREVRAVARLNHPNIVTAHDAEQVGDAHFLIMEYVAGQSLARLVAERGPLPVDKACDCIAQAAAGLEHAHVQGHVHRDIKPQNLMCTPEGQVKILDFGLARLATESRAAEPSLSAISLPKQLQGEHSLAGFLTQAGSVMGTPDYIAPEQVNDPRSADIRADIYSLGCTFYYLLCGHAPFSGGSVFDKLIAHQEHTPPPIATVRPDVSPEVTRILDRMLAKRPEDRFRTPGEVARALQGIRASTTLRPVDAARARSIPSVSSVDEYAATATLPIRQAPLATLVHEAVAEPKRKKRGRWALGCLGLLIVALLGLAAVGTWLVSFVSDKVKEIVPLIQDRTASQQFWPFLDESWEPPAEDTKPAALFPAVIAGIRHTRNDDQADVPELGLHLPGWRGIYRSDGKQLEVFVFRLPPESRDKVFEQVEKRVNESAHPGYRFTTKSTAIRRFSFTFGQRPTRGVLWWKQGWLFLARSQSDEDVDMALIEYLRAVGKKPPPADAKPAPPPQPAKPGAKP